MKSIQGIIALGVLAALVFGGTFFVNYLHGGKGVVKVTAPQARLTFADLETNYPESSKRPAEEEIGQPKSHDFWFQNDNPAALPLGVFSMTCQCTHVQIYIAPADWKDVPAAADREKAMNDLMKLTKATELKDKDDKAPVVAVPAGAVGVLRLEWKGDRPGPKDLAAELWMGEKGPGPTQRFLIRTVFIGPLRVVPDLDFGDQPQEKLPIKASFPCWSSTRTEFPLDAQVLQNRLNKESNPFTVGKPVPFTEKDFDALRRDPNNGAVLAGYMVPVELLKVSADKKTLFDLGLFRQRIELKMDDDNKAQVVVKGSIEGDLSVVGADASSPVHFPSFDRTTAVSQPVVVESEAGVASLTLDRSRTPAFLDVDFPAGPEKSGDRKTWTLRVKWNPGSQAEGVFPRDEDEYRDSAVYIKPVYAQPGATAPSSLRIPVYGKADAPQ
ncbi:MAG TPA: hypothetical protein DDY78_28690 [Planctomycetales bacterium]|jgi:hypothetical protein|nr:hypothetical protein [Planctomycetales bacterium]